MPNADDHAEARDKLQRAAATEAGRLRATGRGLADDPVCGGRHADLPHLLELGQDCGQRLGQILGDQSRPDQVTGPGVQPDGGGGRLSAGMPWTRRPSTMPASTSPDPAVARAGGASG